MKLKDIVEGAESLSLVLSQKFPIKQSYQLSLFLKEIKPMIDTYNEQRLKYLEELGVRELDDNGVATDKFTFKNELNRKKFSESINTLQEEEVDVKTPKFNLEDFSQLVISAQEISTIGWLFN